MIRARIMTLKMSLESLLIGFSKSPLYCSGEWNVHMYTCTHQKCSPSPFCNLGRCKCSLPIVEEVDVVIGDFSRIL